MGKIYFEAKEDHDLLVQVVTGVNGICERLDKINGTIERHENRITILESRPSGNKRIKWDWQLIVVLIAGIGTGIGSGIYAVCHLLGV